MEDKKKQKLQEIYDLKKSGKSVEADKCFKKLLKKYPLDYELMWEYVLYLTNNLRENSIEFLVDEERILIAQDYAHKAVKLSPQKYADETVGQWEAFVNKYNRRLEKEREKSEKKRKLNIRQVIHGDYEQLDGICFMK